MPLRPDTLAMTAVLGLMTALGPLSTDMYLPSLPAIARAFDASTASTQLTLSMFLLGFACGQVIYGPVADRHGRRPVLLAGFALFIVATALCALTPSLELLIVARFFQAFGAAGPIILARTIVRDLYEGHRAGRELARMGTIMGVVPAVAPVFGGLLQDAFGWRSSFVASTAAAVVLVVVVATMLPETLRQRSPASLSPLGIARSFRSLLHVRSYRVYAALHALAYAGLFAFISGASFVLQGVYGLGPVAFGFSFGFVVLGFMSGTILSRWLLSRLGIERTIGVGTVFLAAGGAVMLVAMALGTGSPAEAVLPMTLYTCGVGITMPHALAAAMQPFPDRAGTASSFTGLMQMTLGALTGAVVGRSLGYSHMALPIVIAVLGALALALYLASPGARRLGA